MKVLYILWNYPQISETYVTAEIAFAMSQGISVSVWTKISRTPGLLEQCPVYRGTLPEAIAKVKPDLIHVHYLEVAERHAKEIPPSIPITVRGHSFDWSPGAAVRVAELTAVKRVYVFPAFSRMVSHQKIAPLPVAYSSTRFPGPAPKDRCMVLRVAAALPTKGLEDFFSVARLVPEFRFLLVAAKAGGAGTFDEDLVRMGNESGVKVHIGLSWDVTAALTRHAGIYLHTWNPKRNPFGMSISIAEAMATGAYVLARQGPESSEYLGAAGDLYGSPEDAAELIRKTASWPGERWELVRRAATQRASCFSDQAVLPPLVDHWKSLVTKPL